jgi:hypothetical protein
MEGTTVDVVRSLWYEAYVLLERIRKLGKRFGKWQSEMCFTRFDRLKRRRCDLAGDRVTSTRRLKPAAMHPIMK